MAQKATSGGKKALFKQKLNHYFLFIFSPFGILHQMRPKLRQKFIFGKDVPKGLAELL